MLFCEIGYLVLSKKNTEDLINYRLTSQPNDICTVNIIFHEIIDLKRDVKKSITFKDKIKYIINPPGWSREGSIQIAKIMQKRDEIKETMSS